MLAHLDYRYLETETDKVEYFCKELGISKEALPAKRYAGAIREKTTDRYFVDKFPMFFVPDSSSFSPVVTFSFVDPGLLSLASFETHLLAYSSLFSAVPQMDFVYIATRPTHFQAAREMAQGMAPRLLNPDPGVEGLRYFHSRYLWETRRYKDLSMEKIESLDKARKRFTDARIEVLFQPWMHGQITCDVVMKPFRELAPTREVPFRAELVDGQVALFEANLASRKSRRTETQVNGTVESTFRTGFGAAFGAETQKAEEN